MRRVAPGLLSPSLPPAEAPELPADLGRADLDDATVTYVLETRPAFDMLRQCLGQLGGLLLLASVGSRSKPDDSLLGLARNLHAEAGAALRSARVPERACHHHHHLTKALAALDEALRAAGRNLHRHEEMDTILRPLRAGYREMQWAAAALPGFDMVALDQSCCAAHPAVRGRSRSREET